MHFLVAYDIFDNKRRRKITNYLYNFTDTYQKSALEVDVGVTGLKNIVSHLEKYTKEGDKAVVFRVKSAVHIGKSQEVEFVI